MIGQRLTMRAQVERNAATGKDAWNNPAAPQFVPLGILPCFAWTPSSRDVADGDKVAVIFDVRVMFALGADISADDEIANITDRKGVVLHHGRFRVDGPPQFKHTHQEVNLRRVG